MPTSTMCAARCIAAAGGAPAVVFPTRNCAVAASSRRAGLLLIGQVDAAIRIEPMDVFKDTVPLPVPSVP